MTECSFPERKLEMWIFYIYWTGLSSWKRSSLSIKALSMSHLCTQVNMTSTSNLRSRSLLLQDNNFQVSQTRPFRTSFLLFCLVVSENKLSLICLNFTGTLNQLHFTLLIMFTSFNTISYLSSLSHCFYGACLLAGTSFTSTISSLTAQVCWFCQINPDRVQGSR
jgi:hypothetical protein